MPKKIYQEIKKVLSKDNQNLLHTLHNLGKSRNHKDYVSDKDIDLIKSAVSKLYGINKSKIRLPIEENEYAAESLFVVVNRTKDEEPVILEFPIFESADFDRLINFIEIFKSKTKRKKFLAKDKSYPEVLTKLKFLLENTNTLLEDDDYLIDDEEITKFKKFLANILDIHADSIMFPVEQGQKHFHLGVLILGDERTNQQRIFVFPLPEINTSLQIEMGRGINLNTLFNKFGVSLYGQWLSHNDENTISPLNLQINDKTSQVLFEKEKKHLKITTFDTKGEEQSWILINSEGFIEDLGE